MEHEIAFQGEVNHWYGAEPIAPAVLDWLRWRFRRLQIDRSSDDEWARTVRDELPRRIAEAGPMPEGIPLARLEGSAAWAAERNPSYKRQRPDAGQVRRPRAPAAGLTKPAKNEVDPAELAKIVSASRDLLASLYPLCQSEEERGELVAALVAYTGGGAVERDAWLRHVRWLRAR